MKPTRIPKLSDFKTDEKISPHYRGLALSNETKIGGKVKVEDVSEKISQCFDDDDGVALRLKDEFSMETIDSVIRGVRVMISEDSMTDENWKKIGEFLRDDLWVFSRLKEELALSERKCGMVKKKASEISRAQEGEEYKNRLMACAMLLAETEMRCENLGNRANMIVDEFVTRILSDLSGSSSHTRLELRLRAVFGSL